MTAGDRGNRLIDRCLRFAEGCRERADLIKADVYIARCPAALPAAEIVATATSGRLYCDIVALPLISACPSDADRDPAESLLEHAIESYLRRVAGISTIGWAMKDQLRRFGPPVAVIPDYHAGQASEAERTPDIRAACGLGPDDRLLLASGQTAGGFRAIIEAMLLFPVNVHLAVLADLADPDELRLLAEEQGVAARIHMLDPIGDADLIGGAGGADLGLIAVGQSPAERVSLPGRLFDYVAAGVPIVAADAPDIARIVEERNLGLTVGGDDGAAWSEAIATALAQSQTLRANLAAAAPELAAGALGETVAAAYGRPRSVTFLSCDDLIDDRRTTTISESLLQSGVAVTICCPHRGPPPLATCQRRRHVLMADPLSRSGSVTAV